LYFIAFVVIIAGLILYNLQSNEEEYAEVPEEESTVPTSKDSP
jgi:cytochrome c-type biogenesis protein CcmE